MPTALQAARALVLRRFRGVSAVLP